MKNLCFGLIAALALSLGTGCSGTTRYEAHGVESAQGADAIIEVSEDDQENRNVKIEVANLLPPSRVREAGKLFAVWARYGDRPPVHLANLVYDENERSGSLTVSTPHKTFVLVITAESADLPFAPSEDIVFLQQVTTE